MVIHDFFLSVGMSPTCSAEDLFTGYACKRLKASSVHPMWWPPVVSSPYSLVNQNHLYHWQLPTIRRLSHLCSKQQAPHLHISMKHPLCEVVNPTPTYIKVTHCHCSDLLSWQQHKLSA